MVECWRVGHRRSFGNLWICHEYFYPSEPPVLDTSWYFEMGVDWVRRH